MIYLFRKSKRNNFNLVTIDAMPKGIHHTVSYATSYNDTWNHIRTELRKMTLSSER
ncbi:hypothetical protein OKW21_005310 [Catalinimonas alkaloidigena]|nr:hypothetical protein [Catalinimonas alkaloidigena]